MNAETITSGISCVGCGYSLRGLPRNGACPECGEPVSKSIRGDRLRAADPKWLARVLLGQRLMTRAMQVITLCAVLAVAMPFLVAFQFASANAPRWLPTIMFIGLPVIGGCLVICLIVATAGAVLLTAPEARVSLDESPWSSRRMARWGLLAAAGMIVLAQVLDWLLPPTPGMRFIGLGIVIMMTAVMSGSIVAILKVLEDLARRVPFAKLVKRTRGLAKFFMWGPTLAFVLAGLPNAITGAGPGAGGKPLVFGLMGCAGVILWIAVLARLAGLVQLMGVYRRVLKACHARAIR